MPLTCVHQVPEPWNGDPARARILFVSSNPSINIDERKPVVANKPTSAAQLARQMAHVVS
jgi:hypothetical protein